MFLEKSTYKIHAIPVLKDNIVWVWIIGNEAVVIDPSICEPVKTWLQHRNLKLIAILQTHHHEDHIGGSQELLKEWPTAEVFACKRDLQRIPFQTYSIDNEDRFSLMGQEIKVLGIAAHTNSHIAYYLPKAKESDQNPSVFCGDTLFAAGCGRIFEGTAEDMFKALQKLNKLPGETEVFCAHEYTESNLRWANSLYPEDFKIKARLDAVIKLREKGQLSLPTTISEERETNLFLKAKTIKELASLRLHKDNWKY